MFGPDEVLLIQFVARCATIRRSRRRSPAGKKHWLTPVRAALKVATRTIWTDYQAIFTAAGEAARPHLEFYTAAALPMLAAAAVRISTFGSTRADHSIFALPDGKRRYHRTASRPVRRIVDYIATDPRRGTDGNAPWNPAAMQPSIYASICHALALTEPRLLDGRIGAAGMANLETMRAAFAILRLPNQETLATEIFDFVGIDLQDAIGGLADEHFPVVRRLPGPELFGNDATIIDYDTPMPTPLNDLPHVSAALAAAESAPRLPPWIVAANPPNREPE